MRNLLRVFVLFMLVGANLAAADAQQDFVERARKIDSALLETLPVQDHGRLKPLQTLARETNLFVTGRYSKWNLQPLQLYLGLVAAPEIAANLQLINLRSKELRQRLGFTVAQRFFSIQELEGSDLKVLAQPLLAKQQANEKSLSAFDKEVVEAFHQYWTARQLTSGEHLVAALQVESDSEQKIIQAAQDYIEALQAGAAAGVMAPLAGQLQTVVLAQPFPEMFQRQLRHMGLEVAYNNLRPIFWAAMFYFLVGLVLISAVGRRKLTRGRVLALIVVPLAVHISGFIVRIVITGFSPVTNMYGTMLWVALGIVVFGSLLFYLYKQYAITGLMLIGTAAVLLLTESIPLTLNPGLDPIVAVLRSNFWLTTHVLTITISYAAFSVAMLIGNAFLVREIFGRNSEAQLQQFTHLAYRAVQLGVFLLTAGIILGGIWADYSWGRFWGWDPKETWALIADLGFIAILHARYAKWLKPFNFLATIPLAYLLVIMAWYGVNFILASGLHSYGFSSGGAKSVSVFVILQLMLSAAAFLRYRFRAV